MSAVARTRMSVDEYLAWDLAHEGKHEYVNGEMWSMAGAHTVHNLITANVTASLHSRLRHTPCYPLTADMRVLIDETGLYCYPDLTVVCGQAETVATNPPTLTNPKVIVEVLSASTGHFDKDVKFAHYRRRASVEAVVFVSWPERRVEVYTRDTPGWHLTEARDSEVLPLASLGIDLPLDEVYARMDDIGAATAQEPA
jgi:Uma2 family endonuclease